MNRIHNYFPASLEIPANSKISVHNLTSPKSGGVVKNQFCICIPMAGIIRFQSYDAICMTWDSDCKVLTVYPEAFSYSRTTSKYSRQFLKEEIGMEVSSIDEVVKMAKKEEFGRDCPLYIHL